MTGLLVVIAALLAMLLAVVVLAIVVFLDYARRVMAALRAIRAHAEMDSNESLPAIRSVLDDVLNHLIPPTREHQR